MNDLELLAEKINNQQARLAVIGLGYVGLPVACMFADKGFNVIGVDIKTERIDQINRGHCPIEGYEPGLPELLSRVITEGKLVVTTDYDRLSDVDIILIDVETPTNEQHIPQYVALRSACQSLGSVLKDGALVIVESTIAPGTMANVVRPVLEESSGRKSNSDFFLGVCPERVMPGKLLANLQNMSRVCGGETPAVAAVLQLLYRNIVEADLDPADLITAELTKTAENAYRDVNIAFANELALICQAAGADFLRVRALVNKSPGRNVLFAGAGVGGHCIPKDPWLLAYGVRDKVELKLIPAARYVNDSMPYQIAKLLQDALIQAGKPLNQAKVAILGYAYLEESDDTRNSPSETLAQYLKEKGVDAVIHDPFVEGYQTDLYTLIEGCDGVIIMVAHQAYKKLDLSKIKSLLRTPILVDGRFLINGEEAQAAGLIFRGIGQGAYYD
ncbi:MAG: nucleotide sugar dehydrogenase [Brevefilum sp.]|nr:nucleotide sugar dehydrogenase [Brevefilum sp.]